MKLWVIKGNSVTAWLTRFKTFKTDCW